MCASAAAAAATAGAGAPRALVVTEKSSTNESPHARHVWPPWTSCGEGGLQTAASPKKRRSGTTRRTCEQVGQCQDHWHDSEEKHGLCSTPKDWKKATHNTVTTPTPSRTCVFWSHNISTVFPVSFSATAMAKTLRTAGTWAGYGAAGGAETPASSGSDQAAHCRRRPDGAAVLAVVVGGPAPAVGGGGPSRATRALVGDEKRVADSGRLYKGVEPIKLCNYNEL